MSFLTIGGTAYDVLTQGASESAPERIGQVRRTFAGGARNSVRAQKRNFTFPLAPITEATYQTLYAAVAKDAFLTIGGTAVNSSFTGWVEITAAVFFKLDASGTQYRLVTIDVHEA